MLHIFISYLCNLWSGGAREQVGQTFADPRHVRSSKSPSKDHDGGDESEDSADD